MYTRRSVKHYCRNCGNAFYSARQDARFDSARCRAQFSRQMRKLKLGYACPGLHKPFKTAYEWLCDNVPDTARLIAGVREHLGSVRCAELMILSAVATIAQTTEQPGLLPVVGYDDMMPEYLKMKKEGPE